MIFNCPHCDQELEVEDEGAGMTVPCPSCNQDLVIPEVGSPAVQQEPNQEITPEPEPQPAKSESEPEAEEEIKEEPPALKSRKGSSGLIRWILFILILLGAAAAVYFSLLAPNILPKNPPDNLPTQAQSSAAEKPKPAPSAAPAETQQ